MHKTKACSIGPAELNRAIALININPYIYLSVRCIKLCRGHHVGDINSCVNVHMITPSAITLMALRIQMERYKI